MINTWELHLDEGAYVIRCPRLKEFGGGYIIAAYIPLELGQNEAEKLFDFFLLGVALKS